jgi:hypothetical protein
MHKVVTFLSELRRKSVYSIYLDVIASLRLSEKQKKARLIRFSQRREGAIVLLDRFMHPLRLGSLKKLHLLENYFTASLRETPTSPRFPR